MQIGTLTTFFMWCTIIDVSLLVVSTFVFIVAPGFIYRVQSMFFPIPRETFTVIYYSFLGLFKILIIVFNVVPYVALCIIR